MLRRWRALFASTSVVADPVRACATCVELRQQVDYWRRREERTSDALLRSLGQNGVPVAVDPMAASLKVPSAFSGLGVREIRSERNESPGQ